MNIANQLPSPRSRTALKPSELASEQRRETERLAGLRALDGTSPDLDDRPDYVRFEQPSVGGGVGLKRLGWVKERPASEGRPARTEYVVSSTVLVPGEPSLHTVVHGWHEPASGIWFARRTSNTPCGVVCEELGLDPRSPGTSFREVWLLAD